MDLTQFTDWLALALTMAVGFVSVIFTVFMLPGSWICIASMFIIGVVWKPELITAPWWTFGITCAFACLGEALELFASAIGVRRGGGSRLSAICSIFGALLGAVLGAPLFFPLGSFLMAVIFAGAITVMVERLVHRREWRESARAGTGAAIGRALATGAKALCTLSIAILFIIAVLNN